MPKPGELWKDEPHPMALLLTAPQFCNDARIDRRLCIKKTLEIEGIGHGAARADAATG